MNKEEYDAHNLLYISLKKELDQTVEKMLLEEFSQEELRINDTYMKQLTTAGSSKAYPTDQYKERARDSAESTFNAGIEAHSKKIENKRKELEAQRDGILDGIYEYTDSKTRSQAIIDHQEWKKAQSPTPDKEQTKNQPEVDKAQKELSNTEITKSFNNSYTIEKNIERDEGLDI